MKRVFFVIIILYTFTVHLHAQEPRFIFDRDSTKTEAPKSIKGGVRQEGDLANKFKADSISGDSMRHVLPTISAWKINNRTGERTSVPFDTLYSGYNQSSLVDGKSVAVGYLGNWGSAAQTKIFFDRDESSQFIFLNPFSYYYKKPEDHIFLDTKEPYSNISYQTGGGKKSKEERFTTEMSLSFNKKFTLGFDIDYVYARGFYNSLSTKQNSYDIFASYKTEQYQMHAFFANNNFMNLENGGLNLSGFDSNYFDTNSLELTTNYSNTWNKLRGRRLFMTHKYSIGSYRNKSDEFIPIASAFFTSNYTDQRRTFTSNEVSTLDNIYHYQAGSNTIPGLSGTTTSTSQTSSLNDYMSYYSFKNTLGISLNEGFKPWVKFGLTGFVELDLRRYLMSAEELPAIARKEYSQNSTTIGGLLSKRKGEFLRYNLSADIGILGYNIGESRLRADIETTIKFKGKQAIIKANAYIKNTKPTFFESNFNSRYYNWTSDKEKSEQFGFQYNNFDDIRRVYIGGEINIPHTKSRISGGVENLTNYIYFAKLNSTSNANIFQENGNIQVISLRLDQKFNIGILNFDNQLVYQQSSNDDVLPLPKFSLFSNLYIQFKVAKVLDVQLGVDAHYHTKYYAPGYSPALLQFYNQKEREIGNFPLTTAYANLHLKKTRFFFMMYNVGRDLVEEDYFNINGYAYNPMIFKFGLSWNFTN